MNEQEELPDPPPLPTNRPASTPVEEEQHERARRSVFPLLLGVGAVAVAGATGFALGQRNSETSTAPAPTPDPEIVIAEATAQPTPEPAPATATPAQATPAPTATPEPTPVPNPTPTPTAAPSPTPAAPFRADPDAQVPDDTPLDALVAAKEVNDGGVPESRGIVKGGRIFLIGSVPTIEDADAIVELAAAVLGEQNVYNFYYIDPRAEDAALGNVRVDDRVLFETGSAEIAPEFEPLLGQALALMAIRPSVTLEIIGHTDNIGSAENNQILSEERAQAVGGLARRAGRRPRTTHRSWAG